MRVDIRSLWLAVGINTDDGAFIVLGNPYPGHHLFGLDIAVLFYVICLLRFAKL